MVMPGMTIRPRVTTIENLVLEWRKLAFLKPRTRVLEPFKCSTCRNTYNNGNGDDVRGRIHVYVSGMIGMYVLCDPCLSRLLHEIRTREGSMVESRMKRVGENYLFIATSKEERANA